MVEFWDTNTILKQYLQIPKHEDPIYISSVSLIELENIKTSRNKDDQIKYSARKAVKVLENANNIKVIVCTNDHIADIYSNNLEDTPDNRIIATAASVIESTIQDIEFVTYDYCCSLIARDIFGLKVKPITESHEIYKGYQELYGSTDYINNNINDIKLNINEYLIIKNTDDGSIKEMRFDGERLVPLKLPPSRFIKGKNPLQRCALDALLNPDITIVAILGTYGSGKTFLAMQMGLYAVQEKGKQSKLLGVREIIGEGKEPGYLPGDLDSKVGSFFDPLAQSLNGGIFELESLKQNGVLETNIPHFMKGTTYSSTVIICDEAEDLTESQIRLIGTRLGEESRIFFSGDFKQSLINKTSSNALVKMCNEFKGKPNFACVCLDTDVRSETSKMFAELFEE